MLQFFTTPDGLDMAYKRAGDPAHPAILCVHGLAQHSAVFDYFMAALREQYCVYAVDVVGRGRSQYLDNAEHYHIPLYNQHLTAFIDRVIGQPVHWVGISMGGLMAMQLGAARPDYIRSLVLNDIGGHVPQPALARISRYLQQEHPHVPLDTYLERASRYKLGALTADERQHFIMTRGAISDQTIKMAYDPAILDNFAASAAHDLVLWDAWQRLTCPTLVIRGALSDILTQKTYQTMLEAPHCQGLTVDDAGHAPAFGQTLSGQVRDWFKAHNH